MLLHRGLLTVELSFGMVIPVLAERHRVIAAGVGPLDPRRIERVHVFGFSLGELMTYELLASPPGSGSAGGGV